MGPPHNPMGATPPTQPTPNPSPGPPGPLMYQGGMQPPSHTPQANSLPSQIPGSAGTTHYPPMLVIPQGATNVAGFPHGMIPTSSQHLVPSASSHALMAGPHAPPTSMGNMVGAAGGPQFQYMHQGHPAQLPAAMMGHHNQQ